MTYQIVDMAGHEVESSELSKTPIKDYYRDKVVLLTGGTGFLGQLFVEKLLRTGVKEIYVLTRPKKGKSSLERLTGIFSGLVFEKLAVIDPDYMKRIRVIDGDLLKLELGISAADQQLIVDNVEIVLHSAADVRFDETLRHLILCNIRGTRELLRLSERIRQLEVFLHISTAYSHCTRKDIDEKFYESPVEPNQLIRIMETLNGDNEEILEIITDRFTSPSPNTYTFTKGITEELLRQYEKKLPIAIFRPSIIIATHGDPVPGWINNVYGLTGVLVSTGLGFQRLLPYKENVAGDIICADYVVNSVLAAGWIEHCEKNDKKTDETTSPAINIYNVTNNPARPITYGEIAQEVERSFNAAPPASRNLWVPLNNTTEWTIIEFYCVFMYHIVPAVLSDLYFKLIGSELRLMPMYRKCTKFMNASKYFMRREWIYGNDRMLSVYDRMTLADRQFFPCDVRNFSFRDYCPTYIRGMCKYIGQDDVETNQEVALARLRKMRILHAILLTFYYTFLATVVYIVLNFFGYIDVLRRVSPFEVRVKY